jgi:hypothetical protein
MSTVTIKNYELSSSSLQEEMYIQYTNGLFSGIVLPIKHPLNAEKFDKIILALRSVRLESDVQLLGKFGLKVEAELPRNKKLALYCEKYMEYNGGIKYIANGIDGKQIEKVKVSYEILDTYFKSEDFLIRGKHSVQNFVKNYNLVMREHKTPNKGKYPNYYSEPFANKLPLTELPKYWQHLTSLGLEPKKDRLGNTTDWVLKKV